MFDKVLNIYLSLGLKIFVITLHFFIDIERRKYHENKIGSAFLRIEMLYESIETNHRRN